MSLFGSLFTGVAALNAQGQSLSMISNNIANVSTTGYKKLVGSFSDVVVSANRNAVYNSGGLRASARSNLDAQGSLTQTESQTDLAISGKGFFVVQGPNKANAAQYYTRAGSFKLNKDGDLANDAGYRLVGQSIDPTTGALGTNQPIKIETSNAMLRVTKTAQVALNLNGTEKVSGAAPAFTRNLRVYDSQGGARDLSLSFWKTSDNAWTMKVLGPDGATLGTQNLSFDSNGKLTGGGTLSLTANWTPAGGTAPQPITFDLSKSTQFKSNYDVVRADQDGVPVGGFRGVSISKDGIVTANYTNGLTTQLYKLPVATFANSSALTARSGNIYEGTLASGQPNFKYSGVGGAGTIAPSTLESSNVDLAEEFSKMIVTKRAYSAGAKVVSTTNAMLQELLKTR